VGGVSEIDIRLLVEHERRAAVDTIRAALLTGPVTDEDFERNAGSWDDCDSIAAWDDDRCVGHVGAFRFDSTVPGGARVQTAGVTRVGVLPTHTRQGLLTQMMHRLLAEGRDRGDVLATLHASETPIYRRFGFGLGTDAVSVRLSPRRAAPWRTPTLGGSMRLLRPAEVLDVVPALYERVARWRVGTLSRPQWWWERFVRDAIAPVAGHGKGSFVVVHSDPTGLDDGYAFYEVDWADGFADVPSGRGTVHDIWGATSAVEIALWRYLTEVDLITTWNVEPRPVDEPVRRALHDTRAYEAIQRHDDQWIRILDVGAALGARTYGASAPVTIEVLDPAFAANAGVWRISGDGAEPTSDVPDATVDIATLSAAYLGAVAWRDLVDAGEAAIDDEIVQRLDALFAVRPTPFCGTGY
jgi:predicted acetyltransferase